ncbi:hypothetical protein TW86_10545 [Halomonas sp. S2151]|nr:hypothetical protein TW86_10545 [Halomonas sp. S2151]
MRLLLTHLVDFVPLAASTADVPSINVEDLYEQVAAVGGSPSNAHYLSCIDMEHTASNGLKAGWESLPPNTQYLWWEVARVTGTVVTPCRKAAWTRKCWPAVIAASSASTEDLVRS